jgi:hypothetical protein
MYVISDDYRSVSSEGLLGVRGLLFPSICPHVLYINPMYVVGCSMKLYIFSESEF